MSLARNNNKNKAKLAVETTQVDHDTLFAFFPRPSITIHSSVEPTLEGANVELPFGGLLKEEPTNFIRRADFKIGPIDNWVVRTAKTLQHCLTQVEQKRLLTSGNNYTCIIAHVWLSRDVVDVWVQPWRPLAWSMLNYHNLGVKMDSTRVTWLIAFWPPFLV